MRLQLGRILNASKLRLRRPEASVGRALGEPRGAAELRDGLGDRRGERVGTPLGLGLAGDCYRCWWRLLRHGRTILARRSGRGENIEQIALCPVVREEDRAFAAGLGR